jgi:hypothetical protein
MVYLDKADIAASEVPSACRKLHQELPERFGCTAKIRHRIFNNLYLKKKLKKAVIRQKDKAGEVSKGDRHDRLDRHGR